MGGWECKSTARRVPGKARRSPKARVLTNSPRPARLRPAATTNAPHQSRYGALVVAAGPKPPGYWYWMYSGEGLRAITSLGVMMWWGLGRASYS